MNLLSQESNKQNMEQYSVEPREIYFNVIFTNLQNNINFPVQIDGSIQFNHFKNIILEQIFAERMQSEYEDSIEYQLGSGGQINQSETRSLHQLGFHANCTLYVRLKLEGDPSSSDYHFENGNQLYQQQRYEEAIQCFNEAISLNSYNSEFYYEKGRQMFQNLLGKDLSALNRKDEAIECFQQAYEMQREVVQSMKKALNMIGN